MRWKFVFAFAFSFLFISLASASVIFGNPVSNIQGSYDDEEFVKGSINISFEDESIDSILRPRFNGLFSSGVKAFDIVKNKSMNYTCNPKDCSQSYSVSGNGETSKSFSLSGNKVIGLKVQGNGVDIKDISFDVSTNAQSSCSNQLQIDILDDGDLEWVNDKFVSQNCGNEIKSSCNNGNFLANVLVDEVPYCEKLNLPVAPAFRVFADIHNVDAQYQNGLLRAYLYDNNAKLSECLLSNPSQGVSQCVLRHPLKERGDYYVCIGIGEGELNSNTDGFRLDANFDKFCGFHGDPLVQPELAASYAISVIPQKYQSISSIEFNEETFSDQNPVSLKDYVQEYLQEKYSRNCLQGCVIPIRFSGSSQSVSISNIKVNYDVQGGSGLSENKIYDTTKNSAEFSSNFSVFDLSELKFSLPQSNGNYTLGVFLDNDKIAEKEIEVYYSAQGEPSLIRQIYPQKVAVAVPIDFIVFLDPSIDEQGLQYSWNFGDGSTDITGANRVEHTYTTVGNYSLSVKLLRSGVEVEDNEFKIIAESPKTTINETLKEYSENLERIKSQLNGFPQNYKNVFDEVVDVETVQQDLIDFQITYDEYVSSEDEVLDSDYIELMTELLAFEVPIAIQPSKTTNSKFLPDLEDMNLDDVESLFSDSDWVDEEATKQAALNWFIGNIDGEVEHNVWSVYYPKRQEDVLSEFKVKIIPTRDLSYNGYFVIGKEEEFLIFTNDYDFSERNSAESVTGILVDLSQTNEIVFADIGNIGVFDDLGFYLVPQLSVLDVSNREPYDSGISNTMIFIIFLVVLLIAFFAAYIFLQEWYKKNYEKNLFKNKSDLYNLLFFIRNAKQQKLVDKDIIEKLKKSKWSKEQVDYALNKFNGKRIGMWEIPLFRKRDKKKMEQEFEKRKRAVI